MRSVAFQRFRPGEKVQGHSRPRHFPGVAVGEVDIRADEGSSLQRRAVADQGARVEMPEDEREIAPYDLRRLVLEVGRVDTGAQ